MNVLKATKETLEAWEKQPIVEYEKEPSLSLQHCRDMYSQMADPSRAFSYGKLCRWLGWIQAACVASSPLGLEDMKEINRRNAQDVAIGICGAIKGPFTCTLVIGHDSPVHIAQGGGDNICCIWDNSKVYYPRPKKEERG